MLISREKHFLFVHIQKTAGSSLRRVFEENIEDLRPFLGTHDTALRAKETLGSEYDQYFKAAIIRNPWSRLLSWYMMIAQQSRRLSWWEKIRTRGRYLRLWQYVHENSHSFEEFIRNCNAEIQDIDGRKSFWRNQVDYVADENGTLLVDFVGRYETLSADVERLFGLLGMDGVQLPHVNASTHHHYSAYYTDELAEIVSHRYARDVKAFNYKFERLEAPVTV